MQQDNTFAGGLNQDASAQYQPLNSYRAAQNLLLTAAGHLEQERASAVLPNRPARPLVGGCALNGEEILFSTDGTSAEIGVQRGDAYRTVVSTGLTLGSRVSCTARVDYQGHRLVYFADGLNLAYVDLDAPAPVVTPLSTDTPLATLDVAAVDNGGELPTGIYQASLCLLTASKNAAAYTPFTGVVPVVDERLSSERHELDGAPPQTAATGSIRFAFGDIPAGFAYAQLVVATYNGIGNELQLFRLPLISLAGRSSADFVYYSASQHQERVELSEVLATLADYVSAKVVLQKDGHLLAAGLREREPLAVDWQAIANNVRLGPAIRELSFAENGAASDDYKAPLNTAHYKGYRREEVYSFCLVPVVAGRRLDAYHIPGAPYYQSGCFGTYYSDELYPLTGSYEADGNGRRNIRHHRMPAMQQEPLLANITVNSATLRVLGVREVVEPDFSGLSAEQLALLDGYYIGVQRCTGVNRSVLAQGIAQPLVPTSNGALMVSPFDGRYPAVRNGDTGQNYNGKGTGQYAAFYSPESTIVGDSLVAATSIGAVADITGTSQLVANRRDGVRNEKYAHVYFNLYNLQPLGGTLADMGLLTTTQHVVAAQDDNAPQLTEGTDRLYTWRQNGYALLKTTGSFYQGVSDFEESFRFTEVEDATDQIILRQGNGSYKTQDAAMETSGIITGVGRRLLYNVKAARTRQYGPLEDATYYPVAFRRRGQAAQPFFGGDTFLTKVALQSNTAERDSDSSVGLQFRTLNYFFCESSVNAGYRHSVASVGTAAGTLPYFPKLSQLWNGNGTGVMEYANGLGHPTGYNRQYSFQNTLTPLLPPDPTFVPVSVFDNRVAYSAQAVEGERLDAYRVFGANDYHDIPKSYGPITDLWDWQGLYVHTSGCLWKSFFNQAATQTTSEGEVYLGNGGLFPRPSQPVLTVEGGFAGCQHPAASVSTPMGRFFTDAEGKRQYLFTGQLEEISKDGMHNYFRRLGGQDERLVGSYDYANERFILHTQGGGLSWSARTRHWTSFHQEGVGFALSTRQRTLLDVQQEAGTYALSVQNGGSPLPCVLTVAVNQPPELSKEFTHLALQCSELPGTVSQGTEIQTTTGTTPVLLTTYGQQAQAGESLYRYANHQYQGPVGRDTPTQGRLKGKWMVSTTGWAAGTVPVLIKQLTAFFRQTFR